MPDALNGEATKEAAQAPERVSPLASLAYRDFRLLLIGTPFSATGMWMRNTANAFQVYHLTGNPALLGLTFLFQGAPYLVIGLFGGTLADILDRRRLIKLSLIGQLALTLALGALTASGHIQVWHIYAITFAASAIASADGPTRAALTPELVPRAHLMSAIALQSASGQAAMLAGPLLGGVMLDSLGAAAAYFLNAALFVPAMAAIWMLQAPANAARRKIKLNMAAMFEGLTFVLKSQVLLGFLLLDAVTMALGFYPAMMPVIAQDVLKVGATGLGAMLAAPAFGGLFGFLGVLLLGNLKSKGAVIVLVTIGHAVALFGFALSPWFALSLVLLAVLGFMDSLSGTVRQTSFQLLAPDRVRGRAMSVLFVFAISSNSIGGAYLGLMTKLLGPRQALAMGAIGGGIFGVLVGLFWTRVRQFKT